MLSEAKKPVIFFAFANERNDQVSYLRNLPEEARNIRQALDIAKRNGLCDVVERSNATLQDILDVFQDPLYHNRIAVFHYGGHANGYQLLLESAEGSAKAAHAGGLAAFLGQQTGLQLVFLNGCATQNQVQGLTDAKVSLVIATSRAIDDKVATEFASRFYKGLAGGANIQRAYNEARAAIQTEHGDAARNLYVAEHSAIDMAEDRLPWDLYLRPGAELAAEWNLPEAVGYPLFDLPPVPIGDLPPSPFRHLSWFAREHAEVFFGRGYEIRDLYHRVTDHNSAPIILFYGQSGVGKSSVLAAGLLPRLETDYDICYLRRDGKKGLLGTLEEELSIKEGITLAESWLARESKTAKPLIIILDQVEEAFTRPNPDLPHELDEFWDALQAIFSDPSHRPQGKLILGFRKEWLAEIEKQLMERKTPFSRLLLERLTRRGIIESVNGPAKSERLRQDYGLAVEDGLAEIIADDLLEDRESAIAPAMQILLTKMWEAARDKDHNQPVFDRDLYQTLKKKGILLQDFLEQQLASLERWNSEVVNSGLGLDFLAFHTTPLGTAEERTEEELQKNYRYQVQVVNPLIQQCVDLYLLERLSKAVATRLSHDTLAPLVRQRFATSDRPGQRARRILENRSVDWQDDKQGTPLDESDLELVERGKDGMRAWEKAEERLIDDSRKEREKRRQNRKLWKVVGIAVVILIIMSAVWAEINRKEANDQRNQFLTLYLATQAELMRTQQASLLQSSVLLAAESLNRSYTLEADQTLRRGLALLPRPVANAIHNDWVNMVVFSPDGRYMATASDDGTSKVHDIRSGEQVGNLSQGSPINAIAFNPKGDRIATIGYDGSIKLWNAYNCEEIYKRIDNGSLNTLCFSPDGELLVTGGEDGVAKLWEVANGVVIARLGHDDSINGLVFSSNGEYIASASDDHTAKVWKLSGKNDISLVSNFSFYCSPESVTFSTDCIYLAVTCSEDNVAHVFEAPYGIWSPIGSHPIWNLTHVDRVNAVAFSPDSKSLATASTDMNARIWNLKNGKEDTRMAHEWSVKDVAFSPDGQLLATSSYDNTARVWESVKGWEVARMIHDSYVLDVAFSPDGKFLATASMDNTAKAWEIPQRSGIRIDHKGHVNEVALSSDGKYIATASVDGTSHLLDMTSLKEIRVFEQNSSVNDVAFSPDGKYLATGCKDGTVGIYTIDGGKEIPGLMLDGSVNTVIFGSTGEILATASDDDTARLWLWNTTPPVERKRINHTWFVNRVAFSIDDRYFATAGMDGLAKVWDLAKDLQIENISHNDLVWDIAFSGNGRYLVTASDDGTAKVLDITSGRISSYEEHADVVNAVSFSPDSIYIATASDDGTARIWEASSGKTKSLMAHGNRVYDATFSPDGKYIATASDDNTARVWEINSGKEVALFVHNGGVKRVIFSKNGDYIVTASDDGTARVFKWKKESNPTIRVSSHVTHSIKDPEIQRYLRINAE